jgi:uncharacterized protein
MLQLSQINIYPVKSLDGYSPNEAVVEQRGLQYDRRWMIVDAEGNFFTQRTKRKMTLLRAYIVDNQHFIIEEKNNPSHNVTIPIECVTGDAIDVKVWDDTVSARFTSEKADAFLSDFLGEKCFLVKMPDTSIRRVEEAYNTGDDVVSFADGYPYLIIGENAINDLNSRLAQPLNAENQALIGLRRFRANFIFKGGAPYEEEQWSDFNIGEVPFSGKKPCGRCVMITLNPDTGEGNKEPLATLAAYRQNGKKIPFGQNVIFLKNSWKQDVAPTVKVGDMINIF